MIIIKNGERVIYHPQNPNLKLVSPKLTLEDNGAGNLTFKIYDTNLNYDTIRKLYPVVSVIRNDEVLFRGRVISDKKDFYNGKSVEVEGKLAFLNDSYMEPFSFSGSPSELFRKIIENHNSQVMEWQQLKVGVVTVTDPNDYIVRSSENILNSWNALKEKCFNSSLGGHVRIRYENDGDYIDWLADYETVSSQSIEFARNMIDMSLEVDATETYTAIRPVGAEVEGVKIDITSVNNGKTYIVNEEKAAEYGIIFAPESESTWEDVTLPENLLKKAEKKLFGSFVTLKETYEIKAIDLNLTDAGIEALNICEYVPVISRPHGIAGNYLLGKAEIHIAQPQNSMFYLGSSKRVLSDMNMGEPSFVTVPKNISSFDNDAGYISEKETKTILEGYTRTEEVGKIVSEAVSQIPSGENGMSAYETAVMYGYTGTEEEWLESLHGRDGLIPYIGENENWFLGDTDTDIRAKGADGKDGEDGKDGVSPVANVKKVGNAAIITIEDADGKTQEKIYDGSDGVTPTIGDNGNWYIGSNGTGFPSRGEAGKDGEPGGNISDIEIQSMIDNSFTIKLSDDRVVNNLALTFEQAKERKNVVSGEKLSVIFGKIMKWFADLSETAFTGVAVKWKTARNINGMSVDGSTDRSNYGTCYTVADTEVKVVSCAGYELVPGAEITVKFTVTNTAVNPALNINDTGRKPIYYRGAAISAGYLAADHTYTFRYNGTQYELVGDIDTNTNTWKANTKDSEGYVAKGSGQANKVWKTDADGVPGWRDDADTAYSSMTAASVSAAGKEGLVPAPSAGMNDRYLRSDGTWQVPPDTNTTYSTMKGATTDAAGASGLVPAPAKGAQDKYLRGDGTWQTPPNTTCENMTAATSSTAGKAGLAPAPAAGKQNAYLRGDGTWVTPATTLEGTVEGIPLDQTVGTEILKRLSELNSNLSIKTVTFTFNNVSIVKGELTKLEKVITIPDGYRAIGIVGYSISHPSWGSVRAIRLINNTTVRIYHYSDYGNYTEIFTVIVMIVPETWIQ